MLCNTGVEHSPHICWNSNHRHFSMSFGNDPHLKAQLFLWIVLLSVLNKSGKLLRKKQWERKKQLGGGNKLLSQACWLKSILFYYEGKGLGTLFLLTLFPCSLARALFFAIKMLGCNVVSMSRKKSVWFFLCSMKSMTKRWQLHCSPSNASSQSFFSDTHLLCCFHLGIQC